MCWPLYVGIDDTVGAKVESAIAAVGVTGSILAWDVRVYPYDLHLIVPVVVVCVSHVSILLTHPRHRNCNKTGATFF